LTTPGPREPATPTRLRRDLWLWLLSLVGAGVLLWLASFRIRLWPEQLALPRPDLLAAAAALHLPYSLARALRLRYALDPRVRAATGDPRARVPRDLLYGSGLVSFLVIILLPLRLGELSRPLLLARGGVPGVGLPEAIAAIAGERVVDGLIVVSLVLVGVAWASALVPGFGEGVVGVTQVSRGMGLVFLALMTGLVVLALAPRRWLERLTGGLPDRLAGFILHFAATLRDLSDPRMGLPLLLWSAVYWALTVAQLWLVLHACGLALGLAEAAAIVGIVGLSIQLPGGPAQVGSYQVGSVLALSLFIAADDLETAGASFVAVSFVLGLLGAAVLAVPGAWLLARAARRPGPQRPPAGAGAAEPEAEPEAESAAKSAASSEA